MGQPFRVGITRDFLKPDGALGFGDIGLAALDRAPDVTWEFLPEHGRELSADVIRGYDALLVLTPRVTAATLASAEDPRGGRRLRLIARFGVGFDSIDVPACTARGVLLTIAPDGVRRPVAGALVTYLLALTHKLFQKDRLTRAGGWHEKRDHLGQGLTGRTVGTIGLGNIGREFHRLIRPFDMRQLATDPYVTPEDAAALGVELVDLDRLLRESDYVAIVCQLTPHTYHLLDATRLALLKPTAYLINVARGPIVDQAALTAALRDRRIQGAALDVFEREPVDPNDPLLALDNAIVAPHGLAWTDEWARLTGQSCCAAILDVAADRVPRHLVNPEALAPREARTE